MPQSVVAHSLACGITIQHDGIDIDAVIDISTGVLSPRCERKLSLKKDLHNIFA